MNITNNHLLTQKAAASYLGCSTSKMEMDRHKSRGPKYVKIGRSVRYRQQDLDEYIEDNLIDPTAA